MVLRCSRSSLEQRYPAATVFRLVLSAILAPLIDGLLDERVEDLARHRLGWSAVDRSNACNVELWLALSGEQPVGLLLGVCQLRVTKSCKRARIQKRLHQLLVFCDQRLRILELAVSEPILILARLHRQPAELADDDR